MPTAQISINSVPGSNDDLPINTLVQLSNVSTGGEITFNWTILDQPDGTPDVLSNPTIVNPTLTPNKEGTYLLLLVINQGTGTEVQNQVIVGIRQLKSRMRIMAAGESVEDSSVIGWKEAGNGVLGMIDSLFADAGCGVALAGEGSLTPGTVLYASGKATIKTGLPGQETLPVLNKAVASGDTGASPLLILVSGVDGSTTPANGALIKYRAYGPVYGIVGVASVGDDVYLGPGGQPQNTPGVNSRLMGKVFASSGATFDFWMIMCFSNSMV